MADAITYNFSGTMEGTLFGTNQFTGSFTINANPTVIANDTSSPAENYVSPWYSAQESGSDVAVTFQVGGHVFNR
jgi:hypothetical protein